VLAFCIWRWKQLGSVELESGELRERAGEIARAAGVELTSLRLLGNESPLEANAFAARDGRISLTRSLVANLTRREVDAVLGHEVGHMRGTHMLLRPLFLLAYMFVLGPGAAHLIHKSGLPAWVEMLPIVPMAYVLAAGWFSQRQELSADARGAKVTGDAEGAIAALARLARLTRSPIEWGGIQGSILSHPSMRRRVLALARKCGVEEGRALALLYEPDLLSAEAGAARYTIPAPPADGEPLFATARSARMYWWHWVFGSVLIGLLISVQYATTRLGLSPSHRTQVILVSAPLAAWLSLRVVELYWIAFFRTMRKRLEGRGVIPKGGTFVALMPGERVQVYEGFYAWDLGALFLGPERLTYRGERNRFSVNRGEVEAIEIVRGQWTWERAHAVLVRTASARFSLLLLCKWGRSRRLARKLERQLQSWRKCGTAEPAQDGKPLPAPDLPQPAGLTLSRGLMIWYYGKTSLLISIGAFLATAVVLGYSHAIIEVPLAAGGVYLAVVAPVMTWRKERGA
jgi:hypothetical protein